MEKKITNIQLDMNIESNNHVAVVYKTQFDSESFWGIAPTLFMFGFLVYGMMRTKSMMSGKGGGIFGKMSSIVKHVRPGDISIRFKYVQ